MRHAGAGLALAIAVLVVLIVPVASQAPTSPVPRDDGIGTLKETVLRLLPSPAKVCVAREE